jgi:hypothetical protein
LAFSAATCWEVRPTNGSDSNGGGFVAGSGGTDYSQQNSPQATGTVSSAASTVTATTAIFTAAMVGNYITDGTTWKQITAFTSTTIITVDSAPSWTAASIAVGGALKTIAKMNALWVSSNKAYFKAEAVQQIAAGLNLSVSVTPGNNAPFTRLIGYTSARGDGGQATLQLVTNTGLTGLTLSGNGVRAENITIDCNSLGTSIGITITGNWCAAINCKTKNFTSVGIQGGAISSNALSPVMNCEVTGGTSAASGAIVSQAYIRQCNVHDNACPGITVTGANLIVDRCLITNNTGATSDGIVAPNGISVTNCMIYGNGRDGIRSTNANFFLGNYIKNNIFVKNSGYGINATNAAFPADFTYDGNAYYSNTSGARHNIDDTSTNAIDGVSPYTNVLDVTLTGDPCTNAAGGDFTLNNTAGAGAACRAAGTPGAMPGVSQVGYVDLGPLQHQDSGGGGGGGGNLLGNGTLVCA